MSCGTRLERHSDWWVENAFEGCKAGEGDQEENIEATHMGLEGA